MRTLKSHAFHLLNIEEEEIIPLLWLFSFSFIQGFLGLILTAIPLVLFLEHYPSELLAYTYILNGMITFLLGLGLTFLSARFSLLFIIQTPLIFLSSSIGFFLILVLLTKMNWVYFALVVWSSVNYNLTTFVGVALINQLLNLQQGKRFFGIISSGGAIGGMVSGFLLEFMQSIIGSFNLLFFVILLLLLSKLMVIAIKSRLSNYKKDQESSNNHVKKKFSWHESKNKSYIVQFFLILFFLTFFYFVLDLTFNSEAKIYYPEKKELTAFFGYFFGTLNALTFIFSFFFMGYLLQRIGILSFLLYLVISMGILIAITCTLHTKVAFASAAFWSLAFVRICDNVLRAPLPLPLLNQPLTHEEKIWAQIQEQLVLSPFSSIVSGLVLAIIGHYFGIQFYLLALLLMISIAAIYVVLIFFKKEYLKVLTRSLERWNHKTPNLGIYESYIPVLLQPLIDPSLSDESKIVGLQILEKLDRSNFEHILNQVLESSSKEVRKYVLNRAKDLDIKLAKEPLIKMIREESDISLLPLAILSLIPHLQDDTELLEVLKPLESIQDREVASSCLIAQYRVGGIDMKNSIRKRLLSIAENVSDPDRGLLICVLKEISIPERQEIFKHLLRNSRVEERAEIFNLMAQLDDACLFDSESLRLAMEDFFLPNATLSAQNYLVKGKAKTVDLIGQEFERFSHEKQVIISRLLGDIKCSEAVKVIESLIAIDNLNIFHTCLNSLNNQNYVLKDISIKKEFDKLIERESQFIVDVRTFLAPLDLPECELIKWFLEREVELSQTRLYLMFSFMYSSSELKLALEGIQLRNSEMCCMAMELLSEVLPYDEKKRILSLLMPASLDNIKTIVKEVDWTDYFSKLFIFAEKAFTPNIPSAAAFTIARLNALEAYKLLKNVKPTRDHYYYQIVDWAFKKQGNRH
jgi:MFS family permease